MRATVDATLTLNESPLTSFTGPGRMALQKDDTLDDRNGSSDLPIYFLQFRAREAGAHSNLLGPRGGLHGWTAQLHFFLQLGLNLGTHMHLCQARPYNRTRRSGKPLPNYDAAAVTSSPSKFVDRVND